MFHEGPVFTVRSC